MSVAERKAEADALYGKGQHDAAALAYTDALQLSEERQEPALLHLLYGNRAAAHLAMQKWQLALQDALSSISVNDSYAKAHYRAAVALDALGRPGDALRHARQAFELDPASRQAAALSRQLSSKAAGSSGRREGGGGGRAEGSVLSCVPSPGRGLGAGGGGGEGTGEAGTATAAASEEVVPWTSKATLSLVGQMAPRMRPGSRYVSAADGVNSNLLVMFHGLGDKADGFAALAKHMALPQTAALALSGPIEIPEVGGGRAWLRSFDDSWHLIRPSPGEPRRIQSLQATCDALEPLLAALAGGDVGARGSGGGGSSGAQRRRFPGRRLHLLGFSQGGTVALELARRLGSRSNQSCCGGGASQGAPAWLGSVVSISGALLEEHIQSLEKQQQQQQQQQEKEKEKEKAASHQPPLRGHTPVWISHGDADTVVQRSTVERSAGLLCSSGCDVSLCFVPGKGHSMLGASRSEAESLMVFYSRVLAGRPPVEGLVEVDPAGVSLPPAPMDVTHD